LAARFHTLLLRNVPELGPFRLPSLKRFTHLIDVLYDNHVRLVIAADRPITRLVSHNNRSLTELVAEHRQLIDDLQLDMVSCSHIQFSYYYTPRCDEQQTGRTPWSRGPAVQ
uniref:Family 2 glycosyl transferase n=1 Tax=Echinostoma caproni TaxID=27848 RepID=A0A183A8Y4_9TREM